MRNAGLEEAQAGIKIAGRNINNLTYADDTTLMAESEEELKSLLMKVKEESGNVGLKLNIQKIKIMASGLISSVQSLSHVQLFGTPWTTAHQVSLSIANSQSPSKPLSTGPITSWQIGGERVEAVSDFNFWPPKSLQMVIAVMKLKDAYSVEGKLWPT